MSDPIRDHLDRYEARLEAPFSAALVDSDVTLTVRHDMPRALAALRNVLDLMDKATDPIVRDFTRQVIANGLGLGDLDDYAPYRPPASPPVSPLP